MLRLEAPTTAILHTDTRSRSDPFQTTLPVSLHKLTSVPNAFNCSATALHHSIFMETAMYQSISARLAKPAACALVSLLVTFITFNAVVAEGMKNAAEFTQQEVRMA